MKITFFVIAGCIYTSSINIYGQEVEVSSSATHATYSLNDNACKITWDLYRQGGSSDYVVHLSSCALPVKQQVLFLQRLASRVLNDADFKEIVIGRLMEYPELSLRFAKAAATSPRWDSVMGRPKKGNINSVVLAIAREAGVFREFNDALKEMNRTATLSSVEKVLIEPAGNLPFFNDLESVGITSEQRLPYDFLGSLAIAKRQVSE